MLCSWGFSSHLAVNLRFFYLIWKFLKFLTEILVFFIWNLRFFDETLRFFNRNLKILRFFNWKLNILRFLTKKFEVFNRNFKILKNWTRKIQITFVAPTFKFSTSMSSNKIFSIKILFKNVNSLFSLRTTQKLLNLIGSERFDTFFLIFFW